MERRKDGIELFFIRRTLSHNVTSLAGSAIAVGHFSRFLGCEHMKGSAMKKSRAAYWLPAAGLPALRMEVAAAKMRAAL